MLILNNLKVPDKERMSRIQYRLGVQVLGLGHDARSIFKRILEEGDKEVQGLSEIELLLLPGYRKSWLVREKGGPTKANCC